MNMLADKVAIITGAARGIGAAVATKLSEWGASVVMADLDGDALSESAGRLAGTALPVPIDLTDPGAGDRLVACAVDGFGRLDIVVNNAGYTWDGPIHRMTDEQFQAMLDIHTVAPFRILRAAAGPMREAAKRELAVGQPTHRKVVNVVSLSGLMGQGGQVNYSSAKGATIAMTKALAKEWGALGINVNAVAPGFIDTRLTAATTDDNVIEVAGGARQLGISSAVRDLAIATNPMGRVGTAGEIAEAVAWLSSPASDYVTGQVLSVSGGQMAGMAW
ncbi:SDR family NAD(P)-dependent oxidoreductase [Tomitella fengzijianii]|uniref:SDR family NAD(P)-dependent oxidoreductase n=1 Tax=Tomitella fengzijianii TaxID=2597660 RepID=UPI00131DE1F9|nr:SDR family oxidoreductase [Tomitella fengzijianii]